MSKILTDEELALLLAIPKHQIGESRVERDGIDPMRVAEAGLLGELPIGLAADVIALWGRDALTAVYRRVALRQAREQHEETIVVLRAILSTLQAPSATKGKKS